MNKSNLKIIGGGTIMAEGNIVKADVIAKIFGLSVRRIQQLTQDGVIHTVKSSKSRNRGYDLIPTIMEYINFLKNKANGKAESKKEQDLKNKKLEVEIALKESQSELHMIKTDIAKGNYLSVEEVQLDYQKFFTVFKKMTLAIPARMAGVLNGYVEPVVIRSIEKELQDEITQMLRTFVVAAKAEEGDDKR